MSMFALYFHIQKIKDHFQMQYNLNIYKFPKIHAIYPALFVCVEYMIEMSGARELPKFNII